MDAKVALIPGGARGNGRENAFRLAERGWAIALCYRSSAAEAEATRASCEARGASALTLAADVSRPEDCEALVQAVRRWRGRVDALVHAAGPFHRRDVLAETPDGWREMLASNLDSLFYLARLVAPDMVARGWGRIVAFSIANAERLAGQPGIAAHYVAKVGVLALVRALARPLAKHGVTVNAIAPGFIDSGSMHEDELSSFLPAIPAGRLGSTADAAAAALYLLSDEAAYVSGTNLLVNGGWGI